MKGRVLIVAGSDSGGGAGIQADIKTVTMLDAFAATAVTALTAQNTQGVFGVLPIAPEFIRQQMEVVLDDIGADAVKTGMLHDAGVIEAVADVLAARASAIPLVVDPVMVAKGGAPLIEPGAIEALKRLLVPRAAVLTPNLPEAEILAGRTIDSLAAMHSAAERCSASAAARCCSRAGTSPATRSTTCSRPLPGCASGRARGSTAAIPTAPAAPWLRRSPPASRRGWQVEAAVERARDYVQRAIASAPDSATATARSTTRTRCITFRVD